MNYLIFGGSGFIGTHLIHRLKDACVKPGDCIYDLDLVMPGEEGVVPGVVEKNEGVIYRRVDVRKPIALDFTPTPDDVIFNLAAVHRTPGHPDYAYFETNIRGAENVTAFAEQHGIRKILFTSSIAPYGAAEELKTEDTRHAAGYHQRPRHTVDHIQPRQTLDHSGVHPLHAAQRRLAR